MERKLKQWLSAIITNINKTSNHLSPQPTEHKKTMRYHDVVNPGVGFGQAPQCGRAILADGIDPHPPCLDNWISNGNVNLHRFDSPQKD